MITFPRVRQIKIVDQTCAVAGTPFNLDVSAKLGKLPYTAPGGFAMGWEVARTTGASTCDGKLQGTNDGTNWIDIVAFTQVTGATGRELKLVTMMTDRLRFVVAIGATTTFTVKVYVYPALMGSVPTA